jgi:hypothetical protein
MSTPAVNEYRSPVETSTPDYHEHGNAPPHICLICDLLDTEEGVDDEKRHAILEILIFDLQKRLSACMTTEVTNQSKLHHDEIQRLEVLFHELAAKHEESAYKMTIDMVASSLKIAASAFDHDSKPGKALTSIGGLGSTTSQMLQQFDQGVKKVLEGEIEILRQLLQDGNKSDRHASQQLERLYEIFRTISQKRNSAIDQALRARM